MYQSPHMHLLSHYIRDSGFLSHFSIRGDAISNLKQCVSKTGNFFNKILSKASWVSKLLFQCIHDYYESFESMFNLVDAEDGHYNKQEVLLLFFVVSRWCYTQMTLNITWGNFVPAGMGGRVPSRRAYAYKGWEIIRTRPLSRIASSEE